MYTIISNSNKYIINQYFLISLLIFIFPLRDIFCYLQFLGIEVGKKRKKEKEITYTDIHRFISEYINKSINN